MSNSEPATSQGSNSVAPKLFHPRLMPSSNASGPSIAPGMGFAGGLIGWQQVLGANGLPMLVPIVGSIGTGANMVHPIGGLTPEVAMYQQNASLAAHIQHINSWNSAAAVPPGMPAFPRTNDNSNFVKKASQGAPSLANPNSFISMAKPAERVSKLQDISGVPTNGSTLDETQFSEKAEQFLSLPAKDLFDALCERMTKEGWSQAMVSSAVQIHKTTLSKQLRGLRAITHPVRTRLAWWLSQSSDDLRRLRVTLGSRGCRLPWKPSASNEEDQPLPILSNGESDSAGAGSSSCAVGSGFTPLKARGKAAKVRAAAVAAAQCEQNAQDVCSQSNCPAAADEATDDEQVGPNLEEQSSATEKLGEKRQREGPSVKNAALDFLSQVAKEVSESSSPKRAKADQATWKTSGDKPNDRPSEQDTSIKEESMQKLVPPNANSKNCNQQEPSP